MNDSAEFFPWKRLGARDIRGIQHDLLIVPVLCQGNGHHVSFLIFVETRRTLNPIKAYVNADMIRPALSGAYHDMPGKSAMRSINRSRRRRAHCLSPKAYSSSSLTP